MELASIRGLGNIRIASLRAMGIDSLRDLLFYLPKAYEDRTHFVPIGQVCAGTCMVRGRILQRPVLNRFQGLVRVTAMVQDASGTLPVIWYNQPWIAQQMTEGREVTLYGKVTEKKGKLVLQNPEVVTELVLQPLYREVKGIPGKTLHSIIVSCFPFLEEECPETLPLRILDEHHFPSLSESLRQSHSPENMDKLKTARTRLAFEQMLMYQAAIGLMKTQKTAGPQMVFPENAESSYWEHLRFAPTNAQRRVLHEIAQDMSGRVAMSRLVQGDVGCGKTAVAFGAIFLSLTAGFQAALMAPTEILARQHYLSYVSMFGEDGVGLLTGSLSASQKKKAHAAIENGTWRVIIGTHALISEGVHYENLGLVITDEQHRFGVRQRSILQEKGDKAGKSPHVLVMSATPIPRSLALILYGDLDVSIIDELPPGRSPVKTRLVPENKREAMFQFLRQEIARGRQAYVVCPLVEDSEVLEDVHSAQHVYEELKDHELKGLQVSLTWGEQKPDQKQKVLDDFSQGRTQVLVSTTVIEVGVNVPNASVMIVENAERFGLSQLHQLRGRVGRGANESWCFLMASESKKLRILTQTNDGFLVAQKDLELRGPGDLMGTQQSGQDIAGLMMGGDIRLLEDAVECMKRLRRDSTLAQERELVEKEAMARYAQKVQKAALN